MERRAILKAVPATGLLAAAAPIVRAQQATGWRTFETTTRFEIVKPTGQVRAWMPLPLSQDTDYFRTLANSWSGNAESVEFATEPNYRAAIAAAAFKPGEAAPLLEVTSRFTVRERKVELKQGAGMQATQEELALYLKPTEFIPTDGIVKTKADEITRGASSDLDKARAVYNWVVQKTFRDPATRGCGTGDIRTMLETGIYGGKCADLNALFVGLCRASGVPARDVYGVRVVESPRGYKSMGKLGDITRAQHCRAEFYAQGIGWVPADPADVRKVILEEPPLKLTLNDEKVKVMLGFLFGSWEGNWLAYNYAHDVKLPGSKRATVPFLMYPQAENAEGRLDPLDPDNFKYKIVSRELTAA
ncbi:MAG TPA: transglutaminase domain-containing protein [Burkholderiaceae bacterium]|nr:transglutaminase domain-containing protein [Burkholderiaceae bacterium]